MKIMYREGHVRNARNLIYCDAMTEGDSRGKRPQKQTI